jgi:hypothetical protein
MIGGSIVRDNRTFRPKTARLRELPGENSREPQPKSL